MNYTFPFYPPLNPFFNHLFSHFNYTQQQFQPTTLIISDIDRPDQKKEKEAQILPKIKSQASLNETIDSFEPKITVKKESKPIKKDVRKRKD